MSTLRPWEKPVKCSSSGKTGKTVPSKGDDFETEKARNLDEASSGSGAIGFDDHRSFPSAPMDSSAFKVIRRIEIMHLPDANHPWFEPVASVPVSYWFAGNA